MTNQPFIERHIVLLFVIVAIGFAVGEPLIFHWMLNN